MVTGTQGERIHPDQLPPGFELQLGSEYELGGVGFLTYITPGYGDRPWLELGRYITTTPIGSLLGGSQHQTITIQGKPAVLSMGAPAGSDNVAVAWSAGNGIVLFVSAYKIPQAEVLAIAEHVQYVVGTEFAYPSSPRVTVTRKQALDKLPGPTSTKRAALTSFGEIDAVTHPAGQLHRRPILDPAVEVIRPVWVVWAINTSNAGSSAPLNGIVVDGNSAQQLAQIRGVDPAALSSLTDRSQSLCAPPFGVLTRSEFQFLVPAEPGVTSTAKLMTLQMLRSIKEGDNLGNCMLAACDPGVPLWVWIGAASDCRLLLRCGPPGGVASAPRPSPPIGTWALRPFDARTGPQNTGFGGAGGQGELPAAVASLPNLDPGP
jgi:hypothetical protein